MLTLVELGIAFFTVLSFFIAAHLRGLKDFVFIGVGALLALTGRATLLYADTWLTPFIALLCVGLGTGFIGTRLHRVYLWM